MLAGPDVNLQFVLTKCETALVGMIEIILSCGNPIRT